MAKFRGFIPEGEGEGEVPTRYTRPVGFIPADAPADGPTACAYCGKDFSDRKDPTKSVRGHERSCPERPSDEG